MDRIVALIAKYDKVNLEQRRSNVFEIEPVIRLFTVLLM